LGYNVANDDSCAFSNPSDIEGVDPLLGPIRENGGPTRTHRPLPGSPLIDGVLEPVCPATDQRGVARPQDGDDDGIAHCDIGAVEVAHAPVVVAFGDLTSPVDTYVENGFRFDGGDQCLHASCDPNGIAGSGNLSIHSGTVGLPTFVYPIRVTRLDAARFDLSSVELVDRTVHAAEFASFEFTGLRQGEIVCSVSIDLAAAVPATVVFPECQQIDEVRVAGLEASITTDDWAFAVPEPVDAAPVALATLAALAGAARLRHRCARAGFVDGSNTREGMP
jgi:hypothetical protein